MPNSLQLVLNPTSNPPGHAPPPLFFLSALPLAPQTWGGGASSSASTMARDSQLQQKKKDREKDREKGAVSSAPYILGFRLAPSRTSPTPRRIQPLISPGKSADGTLRSIPAAPKPDDALPLFLLPDVPLRSLSFRQFTREAHRRNH